MTKSLKLCYAIVLFISLFLIVKKIDGEPNLMTGYIKCKVDEDCPTLLVMSAYKCIDNLCKLFRLPF
uniref:Late nodulin n=1 Tax=Vicia faba TaxID=3906 RepID=Q9LEF8_VICFA|nr:late nodulin [Vicia faba]